MSKSKFTKGQSVYSCNVCGRKCNASQDQSARSVGLCDQCYELAGYENQLSDDGQLSEGDWAYVGELLGQLASKGVEAPRLADLFPTLWEDGVHLPEPKPEPEADGQVHHKSGFAYASKDGLAAMTPEARAEYRKARRAASREARRARASAA